MKKLLIASTALSLAGGAAFAEMAITVGGSAELGLDYNSEAGETESKHKFVHDFGVTFKGSGTTDGGLSFSASAGFDNKSGGGSFDDGSVSVSGSFGTLSIGDVGRGIDTAGGIEDVGMNDIGVDDMVEDLREGTAKQIRYENNFGQISIAISAGTKDGKKGTPAVKAEDADLWTILDYDDDDLVSTFSSNPTMYSRAQGTANTAAPDVASVLDQDLGVFRVMDAEGKPTGVVNAVDGDGGENTSVVLTNVMVKEGGDISKDADIVVYTDTEGTITTPAASPAQAALFREYVKAYHLGGDMRVGGTEENADTLLDNDMNMKIIDNRVAAVAEIPTVKSETQYAFGMKFDAGGVTIGVGYDSEKTVSMGASFSAGDVSTNLLYVKTDEDFSNADGTLMGEMTGIGAEMTYTMGASAVTLAYGRNKPEDSEAMDAVGMGVTHSLGGGATLNAGFGKVNETNKASIGIKFAF